MTLEAIAATFAAITILYLFVVNGAYLGIAAVAIRQLRRQIASEQYEPVGELQANHYLPGIAIAVPAYNEAPLIVDSVTSLLSLAYPKTKVIVVDDGSTDDTVARLDEAYDLQLIDAEYPVTFECEPVHDIYRATSADLVLISKENGGKGDALNAALSFTDQPLFCAMDADTVIESGRLIRVVEPFLENPAATVATGATVRVGNGCTFRHGTLQSLRLPSNHLVRFQVVEYLRAFLLGRIGLSNLNSLLIISGAFGLFDTDTLRTIGGYNPNSITEDIELMVRLQRHLIETDQTNAVHFHPQPVAWTEVPSTRAALSGQRRRWFRGLIGTLRDNRDAIGRPSYGAIGLFALPLFLFVEALGPLIEAAGYVLIPLFVLTGILNIQFFLAFVVLAVGLGSLVSAFALYGEAITYRRYDRPRDMAVLLGYGVLENIVYRPWRAFVSWHGLVEYLRGTDSWGKMPRSGFDTEEKNVD